MQGARDSFQQKVKEVDRYFSFLEWTERTDSRITAKRARGKYPIDSELQRILKANAFLILYNMVEATVRSAIDAIYEAVRNDGLSYAELREELKTIWIQDRMRDNLSANSHREAARELIEDALFEEVICFDSTRIPLRGNVDARRIRELAGRYKINLKLGKRAGTGANLRLVKDQRNALAHGDLSFAECGREFVYSDLRDIKQEVVWYLRSLLTSVGEYVRAGRYAQSVVR